MGDSVLDDFYWLNDKAQDVRQQLADLTGRPVWNLAVDETETFDIRKCKAPAKNYVNAREKEFNGSYPYPVSSDGKVYALAELDKLLKDPNPPKYVVLSVTGNDIRVRLTMTPQQMINDLMQKKWDEEYATIVREVLERGIQLIPVICYRPGPGWYETHGLSIEQVQGLVQHLGKTFLAVAREHKLPVVDLSRTFDPKDRSHYGSTVIEPSEKSGMFIARLVKHIIDKHDWEGESKVYYGSDAISGDANGLRDDYEITYE